MAITISGDTPNFSAATITAGTITTLTTTTISDGTNSTSATNPIKGSANAWIKYNGVAQTIGASYNVSSVTYVSTGQYTINFTNALSDANYCAVVGATYTSGGGSDFNYGVDNATYSTTQLKVTYLTNSGSAFANTSIFNVAVFR
jgi:hypothetical protein